MKKHKMYEELSAKIDFLNDRMNDHMNVSTYKSESNEEAIIKKFIFYISSNIEHKDGFLFGIDFLYKSLKEYKNAGFPDYLVAKE